MVDLSFLEKFTKGDMQKMRRYITLYLNTAPQTFAEMKKCLDSQNWEQLRIHAHSLKPQADFMGLPDLKRLLQSLELKAAEGEYAKLLELYHQALAIHISSEKHLTEILNIE